MMYRCTHCDIRVGCGQRRTSPSTLSFVSDASTLHFGVSHKHKTGPVSVVTGPAGLPASGGLSAGPEQDVSVERLHDNGTQPVLLLSPWQQVFCRQATGGDGGGSGWSLPGPTDDHTPGPAVDREPEDTHLHSLSDTSVFTVCDITSCSL